MVLVSWGRDTPVISVKNAVFKRENCYDKFVVSFFFYIEILSCDAALIFFLSHIGKLLVIGF